MKMIVRPSWRAFFDGGPAHAPPADLFLVSLAGSSHRPLATPAQIEEDLPDMPGMIGDSELVLDEVRHPRSGSGPFHNKSSSRSRSASLSSGFLPARPAFFRASRPPSLNSSHDTAHCPRPCRQSADRRQSGLLPLSVQMARVTPV